jgi:ribonuclease Z
VTAARPEPIRPASPGAPAPGLSRRRFVLGGAAAVVAGIAAPSLLASGVAAVGRTSAGTARGERAVSLPGSGDPLPVFVPGTPLLPDQMRISLLGTSFLPRVAQQCNSVFVELGNGDDFVFDFGSGVSSKYVAMGIPYSRQTRVFLTHLHGDHTSDLVTLYCFGPAQDRKTPLHVYGPSGRNSAEGTKAFCRDLYKMTRWHREAFSFLSTGLVNGEDGYQLVAHELPYMKTGVAYRANGVTIRHFPAVHDRDGSISYRLDWNGLSMVFSGDTKPNEYILDNARGVDVLIHEMVVPPEVWAAKNSGLQEGDDGWDQAVALAKEVQDSSHTPELALGYILEQTRPRLGVATHFQANDDTVGPAIEAVRAWYDGPFVIAVDGVVVTVSKAAISAAVTDFDRFAWYPKPKMYDPAALAPPRYDGPYAQLNDELLDHVIPPDVFENPPTR